MLTSLYQRFFIGIFFFILHATCFAERIIIHPKTVIDKNTVYQYATLDMSNGSFIINNNASLQIEESEITGTLSPDNPFLISVANGRLILKNNVIQLTTARIPPNPTTPPLNYAITIREGQADIIGNKFSIDTAYSAGLLTTTTLATNNIHITDNFIDNLHGGILLRNTHHALIRNNRFQRTSSSNIFIIEGTDTLIEKNTILFAGNNNVGDSIDVVNSDHINLFQNYIASDSCYSIVISGSKNIIIHQNKILGGITYAIYLTPALNTNVTVTNNYFLQNRYGLAGKSIDGLIVKNNLFVQRFRDNASRQFWTNNDLLFRDTANLTWQNNFYKEAYSQDMNGNNKQASKLVEFPLHGGVVLR